MKIVSYGKYKCPYCGTVIELSKDDIEEWNNILYYDCPTCGNTPHIKGGILFVLMTFKAKKQFKLNN